MSEQMTTVTFNEDDIREVFKRYLADSGYKLEQFQVYREDDKNIYVDVRVQGNVLLR